jgi:3-oxoacyl-(acyl-carrier-protein) synthase
MNDLKTDQDVVFSSAGVLTSAGSDMQAHWNALQYEPTGAYELKNFRPNDFLSDRRMLKAVSKVDAYGLVAIENVIKNAAYDKETIDPWRTGLFVGAPPSTPWDNENYFEAMRESRRPDGTACVRKFGETCMGARPTTLLLGLPNNVLCYGAILLGAKGPNSNYTSGEVSGTMAVINAANRIRYGRIDSAVAGGFSGHNEAIIRSMLSQNQLLASGESAANQPPVLRPYDSSHPGTQIADGSIFYLLETRSAAIKAGRSPLATFISGANGSETKGGFVQTRKPPVLAETIKRCLKQANVNEQDVGLIFTAGTGIPSLDSLELASIDMVFGETAEKPAVGTLSRAFGNLMEAGGLLEIGLAARVFDEGKIHSSMSVAEGYSKVVNPNKPYSLILRSSVFSDASVLLIRNH